MNTLDYINISSNDKNHGKHKKSGLIFIREEVRGISLSMTTELNPTQEKVDIVDTVNLLHI